MKRNMFFQTCIFEFNMLIFLGGANIQIAVWIISPRIVSTKYIDILPKTNIAPEEWWLEDYFPFWETRADDKIPTSVQVQHKEP